jgi:hypothetical protein
MVFFFDGRLGRRVTVLCAFRGNNLHAGGSPPGRFYYNNYTVAQRPEESRRYRRSVEAHARAQNTAICFQARPRSCFMWRGGRNGFLFSRQWPTLPGRGTRALTTRNSSAAI